MALGQESIDAASFSAIRIVSGAVTLAVIVLPRWRVHGREPPDWRAAAMLFVYVVFFSFAYVSLEAGTGALVLFGAVQLTMFTVALRSGEYFSLLSWLGLLVTLAGLVYLVSPGLTAPNPLGALLMAIAGIAWGVYSLLGKAAGDPLGATANNFIWSVPLGLVTALVFLGSLEISRAGVILAVLSGAVTSGIGYVVWYSALRGLTATRAATVQLSVPIIAAVGGVVLLSEELTVRLIVASALTLGGIAIVLGQRAIMTKD